MVYCCIGHHLNKDGALWCSACGSLVEGAMVGDYRIHSYVGSGSVADVYLAEQPALNGRKVVMKILRESWSEARVNSFEREVAALALLSHPYILPIFGHGVLYRQARDLQERGEEERLPYLVLAYAEQGSLAEMMGKRGGRPWPLARIVTIAKEIGEALDYAHERGVLHRDVKPGNILQMGSHAVLSDFSVAALIDADISHLNTAWAGSPGYMAPEVWQMRPGRYSDQYALAVTCYYLLAGQLPWQRRGKGHAQSWAELHCFVAPRSILEVRPGLPLAVDGVLNRALSKDPHDRYVTAQAFADDLYVASQDITQVIGSQPVLATRRSRKIVAHPVLVGIPAHMEEEYQEQQPMPVGELDGPTLQVVPAAPDVERELPVTPVHDSSPRGQMSEADSSLLKAFKNSDNWVWSAFILNLLACLAVAAEYAWQVGNAIVVVDTLLVVWPCLFTGPLLAFLFRRVSYRAPLWSLFWGVFFGLTDGLVSVGLCFVWATLASLPGQYTCPSWCAPGDGVGIVFNTMSGLASRAIVPVVLGLWLAVIGGAIIGLTRRRQS